MYDIDWIFPKLRRTDRLWKLASTITFVAVGIFTRIIAEWLNSRKVYNLNILTSALNKRPFNVPLITVSNHHSCFDDPGLWGSLSFKTIFSREKMRWSLAANDICFTNTLHSYFFMLGKCIPVIRGNGVYQKAIDFCIEQLGKGHWVHMFPEGKVNMTKEWLRLKWGVGRLIYESPVLPIVIPMWHMGMDNVLPNEPPYYLRIGKKVTVNFGKPINLAEMIAQLRHSNATPEQARKTITDRIQDELYILKKETEKLHCLTFAS